MWREAKVVTQKCHKALLVKREDPHGINAATRHSNAAITMLNNLGDIRIRLLLAGDIKVFGAMRRASSAISGCKRSERTVLMDDSMRNSLLKLSVAAGRDVNALSLTAGEHS